MLKAHSHTPPNLVAVRRALLSVSDKTGIVEFASALAAMGVELVSTGGTSKALEAAGLRVTPIERLTGFPEMMDGRVKTLHPAIHGGLLAIRDNLEHAAAMRDHSITPIDLVCINLYPFEKTVSQPEVTLAEAIENIDIGGPSMVRSAAKNSDYVTVVTGVEQYAAVVERLKLHNGSSPLDLRRSLAAAAFARTAAYDTLIARYLSRALSGEMRPGEPATAAGAAERRDGVVMPPGVSLPLVLSQTLRHGENPHQAGGLYTIAAGTAIELGTGIPQARQLHGKELSYNNINDAAAALSLAGMLAMVHAGSDRGFAACVIKHANPCGAAVAGSCVAAIDEAIAGDPLAAYGGIIAVSGTVDAAGAERLCRNDVFIEVLAAPGYTEEALEKLRTRWVNLRILVTPPAVASAANGPEMELRSVPGGVLIQQTDRRLSTLAETRHMAGPAPSIEQLSIAKFLEPVCRALTSNTVCIGGVSPGSHEPHAMRLLGAGAGQMDRVASCRLAVEKAGSNAKGAVAYSDAFFPFSDGPKILIDAGVTCLVHTGGSKRDQETFDLCNERGVTCLVTGLRHFRH
jgi:phosphoribosylaminoimidazolecarboxamide formyltransferase/IMP cyclohydrolase